MTADIITNTEGLMPPAQWRQYKAGRRVGGLEYRSGYSYDPTSHSPAWRQGYADGWTSAQDAVEQKYGHAVATTLANTKGGVDAYELAQWRTR